MTDLDPEDAKIVTLARATRSRTRAAEGAAVRDRDGRTYAASSVRLPSLSLNALEVAVAMAVSSGATDLEAGAVVMDDARAGAEEAAIDVACVRDLGGAGTPVFVADGAGSVIGRLTT